MPNVKPHRERNLINEILRYLATRDDVRAWRSNTGAAIDRKGRMIRFGVPGQADISGILAGGRRLEIEVKIGITKQSKAQKQFQKMIERMGGLYILAYNVELVQAVLRNRSACID